jgi:hypothetical protein
VLNLNEYNTAWAERVLRCLLDSINFSDLNLISENFRFYSCLEQYVPILSGVNCRIVFMLQEDQIENLGYSVFYYSPENNRYFLVVRFKRELFEGKQKFNTPLWRKIIGKHEFLHCISALFCIPDLINNESREEFKKEYAAKMTLDILSPDKIEEVEHKHQGRVMDLFPKPTIFFGDDHFRLSQDKSPLKYQNLYECFLLSIPTFEAFFNDSEMRHLKNMIKDRNLPDAHRFSLSKADSIMKSTQLEKGFIIHRIKEILLSYAV